MGQDSVDLSLQPDLAARCRPPLLDDRESHRPEGGARARDAVLDRSTGAADADALDGIEERAFPPRYDALVLGCGISGLVAASILLQSGARRIALVDEFAQIGGNHISRQIGSYTFDIGSFIFQDDSPLLEHFPDLLREYQVVRPSWGKLTPRGIVVKYPIAVWEEIFKPGPLEPVRVALSLLKARILERRIVDARTFARFWIGRRLLRTSGLDHYLDRFLGVPSEQIDVVFSEKRMGWISEHARLSFWIRKLRSDRDRGPVNRQLVRPVAGFPELYAPAKLDLERRGVTFFLASKPIRLERDGATLVLHRNGGDPIAADRVVSTIPIQLAAEICDIDPRPELGSITIVSLYYSFTGDRRFPHSILYNFSSDGMWKRLTMHSDFYGRRNDREYFSVEVNHTHIEKTAARADEDFRRHVAANGLFVGDLALEGSDFVPFGYPIYTKTARAEVDGAQKRLRDLGVVSFGRQGGFDYQPTARVSTLVAREALAAGKS